MEPRGLSNRSVRNQTAVASGCQVLEPVVRQEELTNTNQILLLGDRGKRLEKWLSRYEYFLNSNSLFPHKTAAQLSEPQSRGWGVGMGRGWQEGLQGTGTGESLGLAVW